MTDERFNEDHLLRESHYADTMTDTVLPFLQGREHLKTVEGYGGKPLYTVHFAADRPVGTVLVLHGFTENAYKYAELVYSLLHNGLNVVIYDQRGHGRSWRSEQIDDSSLTHVDSFSEYVRDMEAVVDQVLKRYQKPWSVFAHSMGGAVASVFLEKHPEVFSRAVLCAPMIAANRGGIPFFTGKLLCRGAHLFGRGQKRVFVSKAYAGPEDFDTGCATSKARFDWYDAVKARRPEFQNNGPTYDWTLQSLRVSQWLLAPGAAERITCPVRLYTAEDDSSVLPRAQSMFVNRLKLGQREIVRGSRHEIYRSTDEVLFPWWHEVLGFLRDDGRASAK